MRQLLILLLVFIFFQKNVTATPFDNSNQDVLIDTLKVQKWIQKNAIPLNLIEPSTENKDLNKLEKILKDKKIIGLGDATHGTKEFFVLKHRIIEYLIKNMNCKAVALELPIDYGVQINNYVRKGEGDIDEILENVWWWHKAEEIKNFLVWLKEYNVNLPEDKKVSFYGFDSQVRGDNTYQIFEYFKKVDEHFTETVQPLYDFMAELYINNYDAFTPYRIQKYDESIEILKKLLEVNKEKYIANSSKEEYLLAKARVNTFEGIVGMEKNSSKYSEVRAKTNAENIKIFSEMQEPDSKMVIWAHNGHITSDEYIRQEFFDFDTKDGFYEINTMPKDELMGCLLRKEYGDKYYNIGFEFYSGSFVAIEFQRGIKEFTVPAPESNTLPYLLNEAHVGSDCYFIELNKDKMDKYAFQYFNSVQFVHEIGAAYLSRYVKKIPLSSYNAIIFIRTTSGVKLLD